MTLIKIRSSIKSITFVLILWFCSPCIISFAGNKTPYPLKELGVLTDNNPCFDFFLNTLTEEKREQIKECLSKYIESDTYTQVQNELSGKAKGALDYHHISWLTEDHAQEYLQDKSSLADINYTLALTEQMHSFGNLAQLIINFAYIANSEGGLFQGIPLERIFYTRVPRNDDADGICLAPRNTDQHIIVIRNGHYYQVQIYQHHDGTPSYCSEGTLQHQLQGIYNGNSEKNLHDISLISLPKRDQASAFYNRIKEIHPELVKQLDQALLVVVLDDYETVEQQLLRMQSGLGGSCWHNKSIQIFYAQHKDSNKALSTGQNRCSPMEPRG